jgi:hypothetical protein
MSPKGFKRQNAKKSHGMMEGELIRLENEKKHKKNPDKQEKAYFDWYARRYAVNIFGSTGFGIALHRWVFLEIYI